MRSESVSFGRTHNEPISDLAPIIAELRAEGSTTLAALAAGLTARGIPTAKGSAVWSAMQVARLVRAGAAR